MPKLSKFETDVSSSSSLHSSCAEDEHSKSPPTAQKIFKAPSSKRQQLTAVEAAEIFELRPRSSNSKSLRRGSMLMCKVIAPKYGVSSKTIRDIWRGRTWLHATEHLWTEEEKEELSSRNTATVKMASEAVEVQISAGTFTHKEMVNTSTHQRASTLYNTSYFEASTRTERLAHQSFCSAPTASFPTFSGSPTSSLSRCGSKAATLPWPGWPGLGGLRLPPAPPAAPTSAALDAALLCLLAGGGLGFVGGTGAVPPGLSGPFWTPGLPQPPGWI